LELVDAYFKKEYPESIRALTFPGFKEALLDSGLSADFYIFKDA